MHTIIVGWTRDCTSSLCLHWQASKVQVTAASATAVLGDAGVHISNNAIFFPAKGSPAHAHGRVGMAFRYNPRGGSHNGCTSPPRTSLTPHCCCSPSGNLVPCSARGSIDRVSKGHPSCRVAFRIMTKRYVAELERTPCTNARRVAPRGVADGLSSYCRYAAADSVLGPFTAIGSPPGAVPRY